MRSVRCDVCGTKALVAASTCPKCSHGFENRDGFGELLPLAHCTTCDSYYPHSVGACKWCGTKPERSPIGPLGPYIWKGVGILTFASLAIGAWLARDTAPPAPKQTGPTFVADTLPTNQPKTESFGRKVALSHRDSMMGAPADSTSKAAPADSTALNALAATDSTPGGSTSVVPAEPVSLQSPGAVAQPDSVSPDSDSTPVESTPAPIPPVRTTTPARAPERVVDRPADRALETASRKTPETTAPKAPETSPSRTLARAPARSTTRTVTRPPAKVLAKTPTRVTAARAPSAPKTTTRSKTSARWVTSVVRNWAVVRGDPTRQSRIIASIGPNTRVQLGETRGEWRRIKAKGLAGWVEHRRLVARDWVPRRTGRLAAR